MNLFYISALTSKNKMGIEDVLLDVSLTLLWQKKKKRIAVPLWAM